MKSQRKSPARSARSASGKQYDPLAEVEIPILRSIARQVTAARERLGLTVNKASKRIGISHRHLADLELGHNVTIVILDKVVRGLGMKRLQWGDLVMEPGVKQQLGDVIESIEAALEKARFLHRASFNSGEKEDTGWLAPVIWLGANNQPIPESASDVDSDELPEAIRQLGLSIKRDAANQPARMREVPIHGKVTAGKPIHIYGKAEKRTIMIPQRAIERGEIILTVGSGFELLGIDEGDDLVVDVREDGRADTGQLVIATIGKKAAIGTYWCKHGVSGLRLPGSSTLLTATEGEAFKVYGVITTLLKNLK